jgi:uracil phosphoribosyltransferase
VAKLQEEHPAVPIVTAVLDRELDEDAFIRPGLGDAGDRIFGTRQ